MLADKPLKVLIADDEEAILQLLAMVLENMGLDVISSHNGEEAIQQCLFEEPDLIITDILMPKKTGFDLCRSIRNHPKLAKTPILLITAIGETFLNTPGSCDVADGLLNKPFQVEELEQWVSQWIDAQRDASPAFPLKGEAASSAQPVSIGVPELDTVLADRFLAGQNWLLIGPKGSGKTHIAHEFLSRGLQKGEPGLLVALDEDESETRQALSRHLFSPIDAFESQQRFLLLSNIETEQVALLKPLDIFQFYDRISDAAHCIGQNVESKSGGRRVIDSICSMQDYFSDSELNFCLQALCKQAQSTGQVSSLFLLDASPEHYAANKSVIKHFDGVIESRKNEDGSYAIRLWPGQEPSITAPWISLRKNEKASSRIKSQEGATQA